jgi:hypothetical protein
MNTVEIKGMHGRKSAIHTFHTEKEAITFFREKCDELGIDYEDSTREAGGIGHDYLITIY